ncbi:uncharacterized protein FYW47_017582 [Aplochiton taeniatus]
MPAELAELVGGSSSGEEERAREKSQKRRNTLRWFKETQARKVVRDGAFPCWFHGIITRRQAEDLLANKPVGCFLIRVGQSREGYTLSYRGENRCRHYMIEMQSNGKYVIMGEDRAHASLPDLVDHHTRTGIKPLMELLTTPCGQMCDLETDYEEFKGLHHPSVPNHGGSDPGEDHAIDLYPRGGPDQIHLEFQKLFQPPEQSQGLESQKPPVLRRISDRKQRVESGEAGWGSRARRDGIGGGEEVVGDRDHKKPFPRLYPSIRLAMREIQQIQQV